MGAERRSMVMTEDEKKATAYHEAGHALVSLHVEGNDPLHKVTIIPRGRALGVTWNLPERDRYSTNMKQMKARLALCFRSEEHTSELQSLMRNSYAVFCLKKKK